MTASPPPHFRSCNPLSQHPAKQDLSSSIHRRGNRTTQEKDSVQDPAPSGGASGLSTLGTGGAAGRAARRFWEPIRRPSARSPPLGFLQRPRSWGRGPCGTPRLPAPASLGPAPFPPGPAPPPPLSGAGPPLSAWAPPLRPTLRIRPRPTLHGPAPPPHSQSQAPPHSAWAPPLRPYPQGHAPPHSAWAPPLPAPLPRLRPGSFFPTLAPQPPTSPTRTPFVPEPPAWVSGAADSAEWSQPSALPPPPRFLWRPGSRRLGRWEVRARQPSPSFVP